MEEFEIFTLDNGIRLIHKRVRSTKVIHCGFHLDIGSRDEAEEQQGIAHFWEHMAFKGTNKRKAFHILNRLDSVGGELNAFTTKEKICFYASVLTEYFPKAFDLLADITFDSIFPEKQIENEKNVILEEMAMYNDSPEDAIQDDFDDLIFKDHSLGRNILGTQKSIRSFKRDDFKEFISKNIDTDKIIFSSVGNVSFERVKKLALKYLSQIPAHKTNRIRTPYNIYKPERKQFLKPITQAHCAIGSTAYPIIHGNRLPFFLLINLLGGPGMNSRLNLALRENKGYVYSVDAQYSAFTDSGMFAIFFGTEPGQLKRAEKMVLKELHKLQAKPLGSLQLYKAKEQLIGQLAMAEENNLGFMIMMGKSLLDLGRIEQLDDIFQKIKTIDAVQLMNLSNEMFASDKLSTLSYKPD